MKNFYSSIFLLYGKVSSISLTHESLSTVRRPIYYSLLTLRVSNTKAKAFFNGILRLHEFLIENNPKYDQFRFISTFVKSFRNQGKTLLSPLKLQQLIRETYGYDYSAEDQQLLESILREVFGILE